ncbi:hypothetical protein ABVK25_010650 [Lepraria finkii]|uniref:FAD linked oxidase N-terminal domain-containing protein n=1 Tax=Lepraria finkii TaxID=1340010 RepID=A0ABR4AWN3_9LECA
MRPQLLIPPRVLLDILESIAFSVLQMLLKQFTPHALFSLCFSPSQAASNNTTCKALPNSPTWPSTAQWNALNTSISGQLLAPLPPAAVCGTSLSIFNNASCAYVASQYSVSDFHAKDPVSVDQPNWENDACLPDSKYPCNLQQFPNYVINATEAAHVKAAVEFARVQDVRLIVKGTGHDYLGR